MLKLVTFIWLDLKYWKNILFPLLTEYSVKIGEMWYQFAHIIIWIPQTEENSASSTRVIGLISRECIKLLIV